MTFEQEIADFTAFAKTLATQAGRDISLDEAFQHWKEADPKETSLLKERYTAYQADGPGQPVEEFLAERRAVRNSQRS